MATVATSVSIQKNITCGLQISYVIVFAGAIQQCTKPSDDALGLKCYLEIYQIPRVFTKPLKIVCIHKMYSVS